MASKSTESDGQIPSVTRDELAFRGEATCVKVPMAAIFQGVNAFVWFYAALMCALLAPIGILAAVVSLLMTGVATATVPAVAGAVVSALFLAGLLAGSAALAYLAASGILKGKRRWAVAVIAIELLAAGGSVLSSVAASRQAGSGVAGAAQAATGLAVAALVALVLAILLALSLRAPSVWVARR